MTHANVLVHHYNNNQLTSETLLKKSNYLESNPLSETYSFTPRSHDTTVQERMTRRVPISGRSAGQQ